MKPLPPEDVAHVVKNVNWLALTGKRILITGGTGFFGRWMVESFLASGCDAQLEVVSRTWRDPFPDKRIVYRALAGLTEYHGDFCDYLIHLANDMQRPEAANVYGTAHLLNQHPAARFLFTSSGAVYDANPMNPSDAYGISKLMGESLCVTRSKAPIIARCFSFAGPGVSEDSALLQIIRGAMKGRIELNSDGSAMRTYMYASDLAIKLWNLAISGEPFKAHDVGGYQVRSIKWIAETVASHFNPRPVITYKDVINPVRNWYVQEHPNERDCSVGIDEAIEKTVRWYREQ